MKQSAPILLVHNRYQERGGEDAVFAAEARLLELFGHRVILYERDNREVGARGPLQLAAGTLWSQRHYRDIGEIVRREGVCVAHFHNTLPLISPAGLFGARAAGAAVVQTLHNFRLLCPGGLFLRNGAPCEKCLDHAVPWPAVAHRCYRGSAAASAVVAGMIVTHRALGTWQSEVDAFIALSRFARDRFVAGGLPSDRIFVAGGTAIELQESRPATGGGAQFLYVGRLAHEKGIDVLLSAWRSVPPGVELNIIGDGPLAPQVRAAAVADPRIRWLGALESEAVMAAMREAYALILPTLCYENFPAVLAEAQAAGLPVLASALGSSGEIVSDGGFGVLFQPGDAAGLAGAVMALRSNPLQREELARRAVSNYRAHLTPERCYGRLRDVYRRALMHRHGTDQVLLS